MTLRTRLLAFATVTVALSGSVAMAVSASAALPATPTGWTRIWADDFTGPANTLPNSTDWIIDLGTAYPDGPPQWGTGEIQTYTNNPANISRDGAGHLRITPLRDTAGNWSSARIETQRTNFKPPTGGVLRIEGRIQMPDVTGAAASGYWPAFWALNGINSVWGVLHCGVNPGGPCNETLGKGASRACPDSTCQGNFHTYAFEWDQSVTPNELRWSVDGQQFHSVTQTQVGEPYWTNMTGHAGYHILLNLAVGGAFPNGVAESATPTAATVPGRAMLVDYVAVYSRGGGGPTTTPTTPPVDVRDAYGVIQAESFDAESGVITEAATEGGQNIGAIRNGDWVRFDDVDFGTGGVRDFLARVASGASGGISGLVEVRIDSRTNAPIGSFAIANTGGWQSWRSVPGNVADVTGRHTIFLTFTSGQPDDFVNVNWFQFRR